MKKRVLIAIPVILVTLLAVLLVAPNFINWEQYRAQAQAQIKAATGHDVTINGDFGVAFLPMPHAYIGDVSIAAPAGSKIEKLLTMKRADVYVALGPLLSKKVEFSSIKLVEPVIGLQIFEDGRQNWMTPELEKLTAKDTDGAVKTPTTSISFKDISIEKGSFAYLNKSAAPMIVTNINADLSADTLKGPFTIKGEIAYNKQEIEFDGRVGEMVEGKPFKLQGDAHIEPNDISVEFAGVAQQGEEFTAQGETAINIESLKAASGGKMSADAGGATIKGMLTATPGRADFKNAIFNLAGNELAGNLSVAFSPLNVAGRVQGPIQDIPQTLQLLTGNNDINVPPSWKQGVIDLTVETGADNIIRLKESSAKLGDTNMTIAGLFNPRQGKPLVALDIAADKMDFDTLQGKSADAKKGDLKETLKSVNVPYDLDFDLGVQQAKLQGHTIKGLLAQGSLIGKTLKLTNLSAQDFEGSSFKINGAVQDLNALTGIDMNVAGQSSDIKAVAELARLDVSALPKDLKSASMSARLTGNTNALNVNAAIKAMNGELAAKGNVSDPLGKLNIDNLHIDVKHSNLAQAMRIFAPDAPDYVSWHKPLSFSADVKTEGKVHKLNNMKGDLAGAALTGDLSLDKSGSKPVIKGDLTFGNLVMISANSTAAKGTGAGGPKWTSTPINSAWMHAFNADLSIKASAMTYETWNLQNPVLKFSVNDGTVKISQLSSDIYGGKMAVNATLNSPAGGKDAIDADGSAKFTSVRVEDLVKSLAGNFIIKGTGDVNMETSIKTS
ncbi:MAG: AsmA family protein, partial [Alphaproteobacteria bacterium]